LDQDVINGVVEQDKIAKLPIRYNMLSIYFYNNYSQVLKIRRSKKEYFYDEKEFDEAKNNPGIVHFTTCFLDGVRPWVKGNNHPYLKKFIEYKAMSPWKDMEMQRDNRSCFKKTVMRLIRKCPRFVLVRIASIFHGIIVPELNYRKMRKK